MKTNATTIGSLLEQFELITIIPINNGSFNLSFKNSALFL